MINDKDIRAGAVFEGLANNKKIVIENVIESKDGVRYVSFYDDKSKKHQVSYELFKRSLLKRCNWWNQKLKIMHIFFHRVLIKNKN